MENSKTIETLNKYYSLVGLNRNPTPDEKFFVFHIELWLAKSILQDFGSNKAKKLAQILLAIADDYDY